MKHLLDRQGGGQPYRGRPGGQERGPAAENATENGMTNSSGGKRAETAAAEEEKVLPKGPGLWYNQTGRKGRGAAHAEEEGRMKDWDFGFYGKGARGYAHYKQAFDRTQKPGKPQTGGPHPGGPGDGLGCLLCGLAVVLPVAGLAGFAWLLDGLGALLG